MTEQGDRSIIAVDPPGAWQDFFTVYKHKSAKCLYSEQWVLNPDVTKHHRDILKLASAVCSMYTFKIKYMQTQMSSWWWSVSVSFISLYT